MGTAERGLPMRSVMIPATGDCLGFDADFQAQKLANFVARGGHAKTWWVSKDFTPSQRKAIERELIGMEVAP